MSVMGVLDIVPAGVVSGKDVYKVFDYARENKFAIPAFNVTSSSVAISALEAARDAKSPLILQVSQGGAANFAGKGLSNSNQEASITGAKAAALFIRAVAPAYGVPVIMHSDHCAKKLLPWFDGMLAADEEYYKEHNEPLFSSHMLDLSEEPKEENIETCLKYLKRMAPMGIWLEMEIGITGGEEDGVNNEGVDNASLYTQPEDIWDIYRQFSEVTPNFSIAAGFGNVHGVYKPGNVSLQPELLGKHQEHVRAQIKSDKENPVFFVFHGGSGSEKHEITTAVKHGVVKMNVDTDTQWAYLLGIRDYVLNKKDYLMSQVGNPDGADKPNKKFFDPRVWVREGEKTMATRCKEAFKDLGSDGKL
ncbi:Fructose-bisphosphate aldolase [Pseudozyma hubeiensis]|nr:Fructose-bisphosphate aldolase [Pseudozyma hubeiensis]